MSPRIWAARGTLFAVLAALLAAGFLIPYKAAALASPRPAVVMAMLVCAAVFNSITAMTTAKGRSRPSLASWRAAIVLAVLSVLGNVGMAGALAVQKAALTSVFVQTQLLMITMLAWLFLGERVGLRFVLGAVVAFAGFVVISGLGTTDSLATAGILWALSAAAAFAMMQVYTRAVIHHIHPVAVNALRLWLATGCLALWPGSVGLLAALPINTWFLCASAALLGPFLSRLCLMAAVRTLSAARVALIVMVNPVFAAVLGFLAFGSVPTTLELVGAGLILGGISVPLWRRS